MTSEELRNELNKDLEYRFEGTKDYESVQMLAITWGTAAILVLNLKLGM